MIGDKGDSMVGHALKRWVSQVRYHQWSLLGMSITFIFAQICTLAQTPIVSIFPDTPSYVTVAQQLSFTSFRSFPLSLVKHNPLRTPGYPMFLWLLQRLTGTPFANMTCTPTSPNIAACDQAFLPFVIAQAAVYGITVLEIYVLAYWLTRKRWMAAVAAVVASCNLYMYSWERVMGSDLLSMWAIVTVVLIFVCYMRRPTLWWGGVLGLALFAAVMVRPFNEFVPAMLAVLALGRALWAQGRQWLRTYWKSALCMLLVVYSLIFVYIQLNGRYNKVYDLTYATNLNLFEKIYEYRMQNEPVPAKYAALQAETNAAVATYGGHTPIPLFAELQKDHKFPNTPNYYQDFGAYARYIILHDPGTFALRSLPDIFRTWIITDYELYPDYGFGQSYYSQAAGAPPYLEPGISDFFTLEEVVPTTAQPAWVDAWLILSTLEELSFGLLPLVLLGALFWLWKRRSSELAFYVLVFAALSLLTILLSALGAADSFARLRFPTAWAMYLANILVGLYLFDALLLRPAKGRSTESNSAAQRPAPVLALASLPDGTRDCTRDGTGAPSREGTSMNMGSRGSMRSIGSMGSSGEAGVTARPVVPGTWPDRQDRAVVIMGRGQRA